MTLRSRAVFALVGCLGLALPLVVLAGSSGAAGVGGSPSAFGLPLGLYSVDASHNLSYRYSSPQIVVNPTNPNNLVMVADQLPDTYACQAVNPACDYESTPFGPQLGGLINDVPGFGQSGIFVSFDRGLTWRQVTAPTFAPGTPYADSGVLEYGDTMVTVAPNGTFYFGQNAVDFAILTTYPYIVKDAVIGVSKSTDGGLHWSTPVVSGPPVDRPEITADASTGTVYLAGGEDTELGPLSTGNPNATPSASGDRWLVTSVDGVNWSAPQPLGGVYGPSQAVAHGEFADVAETTSAALCGPITPCVVFETTSDEGLTWSRYVVPGSSGDSSSTSLGSALVAADPTQAGHFTVAYLNGAGTEFLVYQTHDSGATWSGPTIVTDNASLQQGQAAMSYSPNGVLGMMWQNNPAGTGPGGTSLPYQVFAAISYDGGATFSNPLEVGSSPAPQSSGANAALYATQSTELSSITFDQGEVLIGWASWQPIERQAFVSQVNLFQFQFGH